MPSNDLVERLRAHKRPHYEQCQCSYCDAGKAATEIERLQSLLDDLRAAIDAALVEIRVAAREAAEKMRERCAALCDQHDDWRFLRETYPERCLGAPTEAAEGAGLCADAIRTLEVDDAE